MAVIKPKGVQLDLVDISAAIAADPAAIAAITGAVDHTEALNIGTNTHAQIDTHIADATVHFTEASIDHTAILNIGTNTHAQIDTHITTAAAHIADAALHFTQATINIPLSQASDVTITSIASDEILKWNGSAWVNNTLAEANVESLSNKGAAGGYPSLDGGGKIPSSQLPALTTSDISEGTNLYYTEGRVAANSAVALNTAKITNATHTGQVTGSGALALDVTAITDQPASGAIVATDTILINDGGVLSESTFTQLDTYFNSSLSFLAASSIGVTVQGFDLDTSKLDVAETRSASLNLADNQLIRPELLDYSETSVAANSTATYTVDISTGNVFEITLTDNCTYTFSNPSPTGKACTFTLIQKQDGTGSRTVVWPGSVKWSGGAPTLTATAGSTDIFEFVTRDAGTTWYGFKKGANFV